MISSQRKRNVILILIGCYTNIYVFYQNLVDIALVEKKLH